jgi:hypothetical protein
MAIAHRGFHGGAAPASLFKIAVFRLKNIIMGTA